MATAGDENRHAAFRHHLDAVGLQGLASAEAAGLHTSELLASPRRDKTAGGGKPAQGEGIIGGLSRAKPS
ncbi:hypothetical protein [Streptomyces sp. NPDC060031]|uniref:hypothetical protein n=1 Tax=Streptomyces sp. NPDC060031 TaxID=3347043 RepID=UPI003679C095